MNSQPAIVIKAKDVVDFQFSFVNANQSKGTYCHVNIYPVVLLKAGDFEERKVISDGEFMYQLGSPESPIVFSNFHTLQKNQKEYYTRSLSINLSKSEEAKSFFSLFESKLKEWFKINYSKVISQSPSIPQYIQFKMDKIMEYLEKYNINLKNDFSYDKKKSDIQDQINSLDKSDNNYQSLLSSLEQNMKKLDDEYQKRINIEKQLSDECIDYIIKNCYYNTVQPSKEYIDTDGQKAMSGEKVYISYLCDPITEGKKKIDTFLASSKAKSMTNDERDRIVDFIKERNRVTLVHNLYSHDLSSNKIDKIHDFGENGLGNFFTGYITLQINPFKLSGKTVQKFSAKVNAKFIYKVLQQMTSFYFDPLQPTYLQLNTSDNKNHNNLTSSSVSSLPQSELDDESKKRKNDDNNTNEYDSNKRKKLDDNHDDNSQYILSYDNSNDTAASSSSSSNNFNENYDTNNNEELQY